jgi:hypothetical protein
MSANNGHSASANSVIESLARETDTPIATVDTLYAREHEKLDRVARIKIFLPVLIRRRVKELLQIRRAAF